MTRDYRNGTTTTYSYNNNDWVTSLEHTIGITRIAGFSHDFDNEGNKRFEQKLSDSANSQSKSEAYQYDNIYRLIDYKVGTLVGSTVPVPSTQTQYTLDPVGNWNVKTKDAIPETRTHNVTNEITTINAAPLTYDNNGNLTEDTLYRYVYDEENRLTAVTRKSDSRIVGQYQYDALSRRVQKIANPAAVPTTTRYFYDDARIVEEQNTSGTTQATYVYGNYIDEVLTMDRNSQTFYYHQNTLWSVEAITDISANVVERYSYDAYGLPTVLDGSGVPISLNSWGTPRSAVADPWMFTGRQIDEEAGLYFYRARYYDSVKGRFLQRDPLGYVDGTNLYEYAKGNPITLTDSFGLLTKDECIAKVKNLLDNKVEYTGQQGGSASTYFFMVTAWKKDVVPTTDTEKLLKWLLENRKGGEKCLVGIMCQECSTPRAQPEQRGKPGAVVETLPSIPGRFREGGWIELNYQTNGGWDGRSSTLTHELVHAADSCARVFPGDDCESCLLREIRAYKYESACNNAESCLEAASRSCMTTAKCQKKEVDNMKPKAKALYDKALAQPPAALSGK